VLSKASSIKKMTVRTVFIAAVMLAILFASLYVAFVTVLPAKKDTQESRGNNDKDDDVICVYQCDSRAAPLVSETSDKCAQHPGCLYMSKIGYATISPYWHKVVDVLDILKTSPHCKGVLYIDSDAHINASFDAVKKFLDEEPEADFIGSHEQARWGDASSGFNAGVWFVRNTHGGRQIMEAWAARYATVKENWKPSKDGQPGTWVCECEGAPCRWAEHPWYKQGAFLNLLASRSDLREKVVFKPAEIFNSVCDNDDARSKALLCHFSGSINKKEHVEAWETWRKRQS